MAVQFTILVANNDSLMGLGHTRIEVWQSVDSGDTYEEITASTAQAALLLSAHAQTTFDMGGKLLKFIVDGGSEVSVSFSALTPNWTAQQVVDRINEVVPGLASLVVDQVKLTSPTTGRASSLEITYSDSTNLGFVLGKVFGKAPRITMVAATLTYLFSDVSGSSTARYRWRFSANGVNPISEFSAYVFGKEAPLISGGQLSVCSTTFVDLTGHPTKAKIVVVSDQNPSLVSGLSLTQLQPIVLTSGDDGFIQFTLVRGAKVRVAIEGTAFVREFIVPNAASFDLLTVMTAAPDPFTVQVPPPFLVRRTI